METREGINFEKMKVGEFKKIDAVLPSVGWVDGLWVNEHARIAVNREGVEDADSRWLDTAIAEKVPPVNFVFYFAHGTAVDERFCRGILGWLRLSELHADMRMITPAR